MNEYVIIELENGNKCAVIDTLEFKSKKYFLVLPILKDETYINNNFKICIYNETENYFDKVLDANENEIIMSIFENRLESQKNINKLLENLDISRLTKLKILDINNYDYVLEDESGNKIIKNIEFYIETKPQINNYIYMSKNLLKEKNMLSYGLIKQCKRITEEEIIKIETEKTHYFLQRYYG